MTPEQIERALQAFRAGFAVGATPGLVMPPITTKHWRRGYEAGRAAVESEVTAYRKELSK